MRLKTFFSFIFLLIVTGLLVAYWFVPIDDFEFEFSSKTSNFTISNNTEMQFRPNMRFALRDISYEFIGCALKRRNDMEMAFNKIEDLTLLNFYEKNNADIRVSCDDEKRISGGLYIAGEGGPTSIIPSENFNVILGGQILLLKDSNCPQANVAIHELLHVLGYVHSENPKNIMYNITNCRQEIGEDIIEHLNQLYSIDGKPDLVIENVTASINSRYLDMNITIRNNGLKDSMGGLVKIYSDDKLLKELDLSPLEIGYGKMFFLKDIFLSKISINEIKIEIESQNEMLQENNVVVLDLKK